MSIRKKVADEILTAFHLLEIINSLKEMKFSYTPEFIQLVALKSQEDFMELTDDYDEYIKSINNFSNKEISYNEHDIFQDIKYAYGYSIFTLEHLASSHTIHHVGKNISKTLISVVGEDLYSKMVYDMNLVEDILSEYESVTDNDMSLLDKHFLLEQQRIHYENLRECIRHTYSYACSIPEDIKTKISKTVKIDSHINFFNFFILQRDNILNLSKEREHESKADKCIIYPSKNRVPAPF